MLNRILESLLLPPLAPLLWIVIGLLVTNRRPRLGKTVAWLGVVAALALVLPISVGVLLEPLEQTPALERQAVAGAKAVVILGGGKRSFAPDLGGETVHRLTLERLRYGARVARATGLPVLVSGGGCEERACSEAELMRQSLALDFGIETRWVEWHSRNTDENARFSAALLKEAGVDRIVLVTHAAHMPRARAYFEAAGLQVIPAPTGFLHVPGYEEGIAAWLPNGNSIYAGWYAVHEWTGLLWQKFVLVGSSK